MTKSRSRTPRPGTKTADRKDRRERPPRNRHAARPRKRFGQHFLEPAWVERLVRAIDPSPGDTFLEIGPGRGALTRALAPHVARIVGIEIDRDLAAALPSTLPPHVQVIEGDILAVDLRAIASTTGSRPIRVAGNLPYNISSPILFKLLREADGGRTISDATLMLQLEVAERLTARPGDRANGALAVQTSFLADTEVLFRLPPGAFRPPPRIDSAVVRLRFHPPLDPEVDPGLFERVVRGTFLRRRKTLVNALEPVASALGTSAAALIERASLAPGARPEELGAADFARLCRAVL